MKKRLTKTGQKFSTEGYKRNSPDVNNPYNIIPSGNITMKGVDFPVMGTDNLGNSQMMMPGYDYVFPGNAVFEVPMAQGGIEVPKRIGTRKNPDGSESTHLMATETLDGENWFSFPTLFQDPDGTWIDMSNRPWEEAYEEAKRRGEVIEFGTDKEAAIKFGEGSWKLPKAQEGNGETSTEDNPDRIEPVEITTKRAPWYQRLPRQIADKMGFYPYGYDTDPNDFSSQLARSMAQSADSPGGAFLGALSAPFAAPQLGTMYGLTGKVQTPSEYFDIENPVVAYITDAMLDPLALVGAGKLGAGKIKIPKTVESIAPKKLLDYTPLTLNQHNRQARELAELTFEPLIDFIPGSVQRDPIPLLPKSHGYNPVIGLGDPYYKGIPYYESRDIPALEDIENFTGGFPIIGKKNKPINIDTYFRQDGGSIYPVNAEGIPMDMLNEVVVTPSKRRIDPDRSFFDSDFYNNILLGNAKKTITKALNPFGPLDDFLQISQIPANIVREAIEGSFNKGDGEFNYINIVPDVMNTGIFDDTEAQKPVSEVLGVEGKGAVGVDLALDPTSYFGLGIGKNIVRKLGLKGIPFLNNGVDNILGADDILKAAGYTDDLGTPFILSKNVDAKDAEIILKSTGKAPQSLGDIAKSNDFTNELKWMDGDDADNVLLQNTPEGQEAARKYLEAIGLNTDNLTDVISSRLKDLQSPEGQRRLINKEYETLQALQAHRLDQGVITAAEMLSNEQLLERAAWAADSRVQEVANLLKFSGQNQQAKEAILQGIVNNQDPAIRNLLTPVTTKSGKYFLPGNANASISGKFNAPDFDFYGKPLGNKDFYERVLTSPQPYTVNMGPEYLNNIPTIAHEVQHVTQGPIANVLDMDLAKNITPRANLTPEAQRMYDYFKYGNQNRGAVDAGQAFSHEPSAFAAELREAMLERGMIQNRYDEITPELLEKAFIEFGKNPSGLLYQTPEGIRYSSNTRIFDFMDPTKNNFSSLASYLNRLPAAGPVAATGLGASYLMNDSNEKKYGGSLPKAQNGNSEDSSDSETISVSWNDPKYRDLYNRLDKDVVIADPSGKTAGWEFLDEIEIYPDKRSLEPYWDILTEEEKRYWNDEGPIGRHVRMKAREGHGLTADDATDFVKALTLGPLDDALEIVSVPSALAAEGFAQLKGDQYDYSNALPSFGTWNNTQRAVSETAADEVKWISDKTGIPEWAVGFGVDFVTDPAQWIPATAAAKTPMQAIKTGARIAKTGARRGMRTGLNRIANAVDNIPSRINPKYYNPTSVSTGNPDVYYRTAGLDAYEDFVNSGVLRTQAEVTDNPIMGLLETKREISQVRDAIKDYGQFTYRHPTNFRAPYFSRGRTADMTSGADNYLFQTRPEMVGHDAFTSGQMNILHGSGNARVPVKGYGIMDPMQRSADNFDVFKKSWWHGYKPVKALGGQLPSYQDAGQVSFQSLDPRLQNGYNSTDATYVRQDIVDPYIINRSETQRFIDESVPQTATTYVPPEPKEWLLNKAANPVATLGYIARGQRIPDRINNDNKENALDYAFDIINPGAWANYGVKSYKDFKEGNIVGGLSNALGAVPAIPAAFLYADDIIRVGNKIPEVINPNYFKPNSNMMYRGIGREGMEDALQSGVFRAKPADQTPARILDTGVHKVDIAKRFYKTYYSPDFKVAKHYGKGFIAEVPRDAANFKRRYPGEDWSWMTTDEIPVSQGQLLQKNWWSGYKPIKELGGQLPKAQWGMSDLINSGVNAAYDFGNSIADWWNEFTQDEEPVKPQEQEIPAQQENETLFTVTPDLLYKQAFVESRLDPKAKNKKGYMGLGQIGDALIADYKKKNGIQVVDPFDPQQNHDIQEWSMNELYNSSFIDKPGSTNEVRLLKALAAYNWGRGNMLNFLEDQKGRGVDIYQNTSWINDLPQETKDYINMIVYDGVTEGRPQVQENFKKTLDSDEHDYLRKIYFHKKGGEMNNFQIYKDYVYGVYDKTEMKKPAKKVYDKLNRMFYKEAKESGLSVPNYIMSVAMKQANN